MVLVVAVTVQEVVVLVVWVVDVCVDVVEVVSVTVVSVVLVAVTVVDVVVVEEVVVVVLVVTVIVRVTVVVVVVVTVVRQILGRPWTASNAGPCKISQLLSLRRGTERNPSADDWAPSPQTAARARAAGSQRSSISGRGRWQPRAHL
mmetsp:Transcript_7731/g.17727  ORF Transcript_7731/g.17727 Transcript_7731/m.17727 type:complete len:147 (-) Transcript_7731:6-446(-)